LAAIALRVVGRNAPSEIMRRLNGGFPEETLCGSAAEPTDFPSQQSAETPAIT